MRKQQNILLSILCLLAFTWTSCEEKIEIDVNSTDPKLVVEGQITDAKGYLFNYVKLTLSSNYFGDDPTPFIETAVVTLYEDGVLVDTLPHFIEGYYGLPDTNFTGKVGSTYKLHVLYDGEEYEATETMRPVPTIDSLTYSYDEGSIFVDEGYYVYINTQEFPEPGDFYRFLYYTNGRLEEATGFFVSDEFINGSYVTYNFNNSYTQELNDTVVIQTMSITEAAYNFYSDLEDQESSGNLFDTPPGNIRGNISNGGYGFFAASSVVSDTIVILE